MFYGKTFIPISNFFSFWEISWATWLCKNICADIQALSRFTFTHFPCVWPLVTIHVLFFPNHLILDLGQYDVQRVPLQTMQSKHDCGSAILTLDWTKRHIMQWHVWHSNVLENHKCTAELESIKKRGEEWRIYKISPYPKPLLGGNCHCYNSSKDIVNSCLFKFCSKQDFLCLLNQGFCWGWGVKRGILSRVLVIQKGCLIL